MTPEFDDLIKRIEKPIESIISPGPQGTWVPGVAANFKDAHDAAMYAKAIRLAVNHFQRLVAVAEQAKEAMRWAAMTPSGERLFKEAIVLLMEIDDAARKSP